MDKKTLVEFEQSVCPSCGSCSGMFTANSMNSMMEALGMTLPYNGTALADSEDRRIRKAAQQVVAAVKNDLKPRDIMTKEAFDDCYALYMAMGGSTNTVLHGLAIANEAGIPYSENDINDIAKRTTFLAKIAPSSIYTMLDVHDAGGIPAILNQLLEKGNILHPDRMTVSGKTLKVVKSKTKRSSIPLAIPTPNKVVYQFCTVTLPRMVPLSKVVGSMLISMSLLVPQFASVHTMKQKKPLMTGVFKQAM